MRRTAKDVGERAIIESMIKCYARDSKALPFGDDVAAVDIGGGSMLVMGGDMLVAKTDVPPGMTLRQAARKAVVSTVSDFAAKGVAPRALYTSIVLPPDLDAKDVDQIAKGFNDGAREYGMRVVGGDTNESGSDLAMACFVTGVADRHQIMFRKGCKSGDILAVTGPFGDTGAGLKVLIGQWKTPPELRKALLKRVYKPRARLREGLALSKSRSVTASIDSSDGLAWSLFELQRANGVGFMVDRLPISDSAKQFAKLSGADPLDLVFYGGEEFELVVTVGENFWEKAEDAIKRVGGSLVRIGCVVEGRSIKAKHRGTIVEVEPKGFEHFRKPYA